MGTSRTFKSTCFYAILVSILLFLLEGFSVVFVLMLTNNQEISYFLGYLLTILIITYKYKGELINDLSNILLYNILGNISSNESDFRSMLFSSPFLMSISVGILGPIVEELAFRFPYKNIKTNKYLSFFIYTFIFAFIHVIANLSFGG